MSKEVFGSIAHRNDTAENWARAINFSPKKGEIIIYNPDPVGTEYTKTVIINGESYEVNSSSHVRFKIGDGITNVNALPFVATFADDEDIFAKYATTEFVEDYLPYESVKNHVSGESIIITDASPIEHIMDVKVRSDNPDVDVSTVTLNRRGKNLFNDVYDENTNPLESFESADGTKTYYGYCIPLPAGKYMISTHGIYDSHTFINWKVQKDDEFFPSESTFDDVGGLSSVNTNYIVTNEGITYPDGIDITLPDDGYKLWIHDLWGYDKTTAASKIAQVKIQIEAGTIKTDYEPYTITQYPTDSEGIVKGITSLYPTTYLFTDTEGVLIDCEYIQTMGLDYGVAQAIDNKLNIENNIQPKLDSIEEGANKYIHPTCEHEGVTSGLYKITVNGEGHISAVTEVAKKDLTNLIGNPSETEAGLQSVDDKKKLDGIAARAQVNVIEEVQVNGTPVKPSSSKVVNIPVPNGALAEKDEIEVADLNANLKSLLGISVDDKNQLENTLAKTITEHTNKLSNLQAAVDSKLNANALDCEVAVRFDDGNWITFKAMQIENPSDLPTETISTTTDQ